MPRDQPQAPARRGERRRLDSVGRNNEADGWWAIGQLLDHLATHDAYKYELDLLACLDAPDTTGGRLEGIGQAWSTYLSWSLARHHVPAEHLAAAKLTILVDWSANTFDSWRRSRSRTSSTCAS